MTLDTSLSFPMREMVDSANSGPGTNSSVANSIPVVFIHGAGGNSLSWPIELRRHKGGNFFFIDLPGHGKSTIASMQSIPMLARYVCEKMDSFHLGRAVIVGHSLGGAIALHMAVNHANKVLGLILVSSAAKLKVAPFFLSKPSNNAGFEQMLRKLVELSFGSSVAPRTKDLAYQRLLELRPSVLHNDFCACANFNITSQLADITQPCLILGGLKDRMVEPSNWNFLADHIINSQLITFPLAGHHLLLEHPHEVSKCVLDFLGTVNYSPGRSFIPQG